jgi:hypothetical protein
MKKSLFSQSSISSSHDAYSCNFCHGRTSSSVASRCFFNPQSPVFRPYLLVRSSCSNSSKYSSQSYSQHDSGYKSLRDSQVSVTDSLLASIDYDKLAEAIVKHAGFIPVSSSSKSKSSQKARSHNFSVLSSVLLSNGFSALSSKSSKKKVKSRKSRSQRQKERCPSWATVSSSSKSSDHKKSNVIERSFRDSQKSHSGSDLVSLDPTRGHTSASSTNISVAGIGSSASTGSDRTPCPNGESQVGLGAGLATGFPKPNLEGGVSQSSHPLPEKLGTAAMTQEASLGNVPLDGHSSGEKSVSFQPPDLCTKPRDSCSSGARALNSKSILSGGTGLNLLLNDHIETKGIENQVASIVSDVTYFTASSCRSNGFGVPHVSASSTELDTAQLACDISCASDKADASASHYETDNHVVSQSNAFKLDHSEVRSKNVDDNTSASEASSSAVKAAISESELIASKGVASVKCVSVDVDSNTSVSQDFSQKSSFSIPNTCQIICADSVHFPATLDPENLDSFCSMEFVKLLPDSVYDVSYTPICPLETDGQFYRKLPQGKSIKELALGTVGLAIRTDTSSNHTVWTTVVTELPEGLTLGSRDALDLGLDFTPQPEQNFHNLPQAGGVSPSVSTSSVKSESETEIQKSDLKPFSSDTNVSDSVSAPDTDSGAIHDTSIVCDDSASTKCDSQEISQGLDSLLSLPNVDVVICSRTQVSVKLDKSMDLPICSVEFVQSLPEKIQKRLVKSKPKPHQHGSLTLHSVGKIKISAAFKKWIESFNCIVVEEPVGLILGKNEIQNLHFYSRQLPYLHTASCHMSSWRSCLNKSAVCCC